jgi:ATP-binding cassette subfamily G (WHITE) protein 2 (SNQ2)
MATTEPEAFASIVHEPHGHGNIITRMMSNSSAFSARRRSRAYDSGEEEDEKDEPISTDWSMIPDIRAMAQQSEQDNVKSRKLGVTWRNLTVKGVGADAAINENVGSQFNIPRVIKEKRHGSPLTTIIENSHGCVKPGEMLLVLGRPGAGCTTLLKILANRRDGYAEVEGDVKFGTLDHKEAQKYRGQIVMNTEEELFFPTLTVGQTIDFATRMKIPFHLPSNIKSPTEYQKENRDFLLKSMGISHTHDTKGSSSA